MTKEVVNEFVIREFVPDIDKPRCKHVGEITVYDDFTVEWEYDGRFLPYVRKTIYEMERGAPRTQFAGSASDGPTSDTVIEEEESAVHFAESVAGALKSKPYDNLRDRINVIEDV